MDFSPIFVLKPQDVVVFSAKLFIFPQAASLLSEEVLPEWYEKKKEKIDIIVVDPPRKGCERELLKTIVKMISIFT